MHPRYLTQRNDAAQAAIEGAAQTLAHRLGLPDEALLPIRVTDRDPEVQAMLRREAVAALLSQVTEVAQAPPPPEVDTLPECLRDRLIAIRGMGPVLADEVLRVLTEAIGPPEEEDEEKSPDEEALGAPAGKEGTTPISEAAT